VRRTGHVAYTASATCGSGLLLPLLDIANWVVVLSTLLVIALSVALHYEVLLACSRYLPRMSGSRRPRVMIVIFAVLFAHAIEIWLFAISYYVLSNADGFGAIIGETEVVTILEYAYFSGLVYSTVGFGDLVPVGPIRFTAGMESLTGLVMITWSASYTYLEMRRDWPVDPR
jgi:hypothetical protein